MEEPLVSIVTSAYNEEEYIESHIKSIIAQTYNNIEHIVINDGSTDSTKSILQKYEEDYNLRIYNEPNEGLPSAMNKGFEKVRGEIVIWLNADDIFVFPETVSRVTNEFQEKTSIDVIYGNRAFIDSDNHLQKFRMNYPLFSRRRLLDSCFAAFNFFRKEVIDEHRLNTEFDYAPDYEFFLQLAHDNYNFHYLNEILYCYRKHQDTLTHGNRDAQRQEGLQIQNQFRKNKKRNPTLFHQFKGATTSIFETIYQLYGVKYVYDVYSGKQKTTPVVEPQSLPKVLINTVLHAF